MRTPNFAHIATVRRDGSALVTPIWVDLQDDVVLVNGMEGRAWRRNLMRDPRVTLSVSAMANPYLAQLMNPAGQATSNPLSR